MDFNEKGTMVLGCGPYHIGKIVIRVLLEVETVREAEKQLCRNLVCLEGRTGEEREEEE